MDRKTKNRVTDPPDPDQYSSEELKHFIRHKQNQNKVLKDLIDRLEKKKQIAPDEEAETP